MQSDFQAPIELRTPDRNLIIRKSPTYSGIVEICDQDIPILKVSVNPDEPTSTVLGIVGEFLADEALPSREVARTSGPEWESLWEPWEGRLLANGLIELDIDAVLKDIVTDHDLHRCMDTCRWAATGDDVGHIENWSNTEELLDAVRHAISDQLVAGNEYLLKMRVESPEGTTEIEKSFQANVKITPINH